MAVCSLAPASAGTRRLYSRSPALVLDQGCRDMGKNEVELYGVGAGISPASASVARTRQSSAASGQSTHGIDTAWRRDEQI
jgi:hypothetical protein